MKYQFQSSQGPFNYNVSFFTDAIKLLVSINFIIFILQTISSSETVFFPLFGLVPKLVWSDFMLWQPFTYMFFHGGVWHVLINMFVLWMFGGELERLWGKNRFLKFYFYTGIGALKLLDKKKDNSNTNQFASDQTLKEALGAEDLLDFFQILASPPIE